MKNITKTVLCSGLALALNAGTALAEPIPEKEPNNSVVETQRLSAAEAIEVRAAIGSVQPGENISDLDFYVFHAKKDDVITIDIDCGFRCGQRSVDTVLAVFSDGGGFRVLRWNDDGAGPADPGSNHRYDARIDNFKPESDGRVIVGVSNYPRYFSNGGVTYNNTVRNGDYTLVVTGVTPEALVVNIEVKPGSEGAWAPINPKSRGKVPVAVLSSDTFDAMTVDPNTLMFGKTGSEASLSRCGKNGEDVNGDGRLDLVCHFSNQAAGFDAYTAEGVLTGSLEDGTNIIGQAPLKVVPNKRAE